MDHKHVEVILEAHDYCDEYSTLDVVDDLINYIECVELKSVDQHYEVCILNKKKDAKVEEFK